MLHQLRVVQCCTAVHNVVVIDVPNDPAVMRAKLNRPEAPGIRSGGSPDNAIEMRGMKKNAIATPCTSVGTSNVPIVASVLKCCRMYNTSANTAKDTVTKIRGSTRVCEPRHDRGQEDRE